MREWGQLAVVGVWTSVCFLFAVIPEFVMYVLWLTVAPETEAGRIILAGLFLLGGGSLCVLFLVLAVGLWVAGSSVILGA